MAGLRDPRKPKLRQILAKSASSFTNLGVAGVTAVAAAALASWPILAIGGAAYAALVAWDVANPDFWKKAMGGKSGPESARLPDPAKIPDQELADAVRGILAARAEIAKTLKDTPAEVKDHLAEAIGQIAELERHAIVLVARGGDLTKYLNSVDRSKILAEQVALGQKVRSTADAQAAAQYQTARQARDEQLKAIEDIGGARERIGANLATIVATLEALPAKIMRMRALDAQAADELSGTVNEELQRMNGQIVVFEETLKSLAEVTRT
jgi:hypothetical protein